MPPFTKERNVASFTDAWIETALAKLIATPRVSHLLQMRGLKLTSPILLNTFAMSHLLQMRGLKPLRMLWFPVCLVASFTDAWIETSYCV